MADEDETEQQNGSDEVGKAWGDPISEERQAELRALFERQKEWAAQPEATRGASVFNSVELTGADVYWLAEVLGRDEYGMLPNLHLEEANLREARLERADLRGAHLVGADLIGAHLEGTDLRGAQVNRANLEDAHLEGVSFGWAQLEGAFLGEAHLERVDLRGAHLERADLGGAHMEGADLGGAQLKEANVNDAHLEGAKLGGARLEGASFGWAHLEGADLGGAHLEGVDLREAHLEGANLRGAQLKGADLGGARLEGADLREARLEKAFLRNAHLEGADLTRATFNVQTELRGIVLSDTPHSFNALALRARRQHVYGSVSLADIHWSDVDLTVVDWSNLKQLGDERRKWWWRSRREAEQATRANTQLARRLRGAGMSDDADRFAYRAHVCQRDVHLLRRQVGRWLFSWLLYVLAGYGYRPLRTLFWYLATIASFAFSYYWTTRGVITLGAHRSGFQPLVWYEALVLSISSFHGRGLFPTGMSLGDPIAILAAVEAIIGLLIEITFIATFTQRFVAR